MTIIREFDDLEKDLKENGLPCKDIPIVIYNDVKNLKYNIETLRGEIQKQQYSNNPNILEIEMMKLALETSTKSLDKATKNLSPEINGEFIHLFDARDSLLMEKSPFHKIDLGIN